MTKSDVREQNYIRQGNLRTNAAWALSPKQKRRIEHKKNSQAAQWRRNAMGEAKKNGRKIRNDVDYGVIARGLASVGRRWGKSRKDGERLLDALTEEASKPPVALTESQDAAITAMAEEAAANMDADPGEMKTALLETAAAYGEPKPMCPTCSAVADERCRTRNNEPTRRHKNRP